MRELLSKIGGGKKLKFINDRKNNLILETEQKQF